MRKSFKFALLVSVAMLATAPIATAHGRNDQGQDNRGRSERSGSSHIDGGERGRNRGPEAHGRGGDRVRVGEDVGNDGVKRRGDGTIDDDAGDRGRKTETGSSGVKRRGDGSIDDSSTHAPKGV